MKKWVFGIVFSLSIQAHHAMNEVDPAHHVMNEVDPDLMIGAITSPGFVAFVAEREKKEQERFAKYRSLPTAVIRQILEHEFQLFLALSEGFESSTVVPDSWFARSNPYPEEIQKSIPEGILKLWGDYQATRDTIPSFSSTLLYVWAEREDISGFLLPWIQKFLDRFGEGVKDLIAPTLYANHYNAVLNGTKEDQIQAVTLRYMNRGSSEENKRLYKLMRSFFHWDFKKKPDALDFVMTSGDERLVHILHHNWYKPDSYRLEIADLFLETQGEMTEDLIKKALKSKNTRTVKWMYRRVIEERRREFYPALRSLYLEARKIAAGLPINREGKANWDAVSFSRFILRNRHKFPYELGPNGELLPDAALREGF